MSLRIRALDYGGEFMDAQQRVPPSSFGDDPVDEARPVPSLIESSPANPRSQVALGNAPLSEA